MENINALALQFESALLQVNRIKAAEIVEKAYALTNSFEVLESLIIKTLEKIGLDWENGSASLSQVYISGIICEELINKLPYKTGARREDFPKMAIGVLLDHHSLGKRIIYSVLNAAGFEVMDFGQGLTVNDLVEKTLGNKIEILLISTLMLPSALKVALVKEKLKANGAKTKIIVGGAPFRLDPNLWQKVGADADGKGTSEIISILGRVAREENA